MNVVFRGTLVILFFIEGIGKLFMMLGSKQYFGLLASSYRQVPLLNL
jgi:hypothetical protein